MQNTKGDYNLMTVNRSVKNEFSPCDETWAILQGIEVNTVWESQVAKDKSHIK